MSNIIKTVLIRIIASSSRAYIYFGKSKFRAKHATRPAAVDVARLPETTVTQARATPGTAAARCKGN